MALDLHLENLRENFRYLAVALSNVTQNKLFTHIASVTTQYNLVPA